MKRLFKRKNQNNVERLQNIINYDKKIQPNAIKKVLESEIKRVLKSYVELSENDFNLNISIDELGKYIIEIKAVGNDIKNFKVVNGSV